MNIEPSLVGPPPTFGNCQSCGFHTALMPVHILTGEKFLGNPVFDDLLVCQLCADTHDMKGDKLMRYLTNLILSRGYYENP